MGKGRAARAYKAFRGMAPREIVEIPLPDETTYGWHLGDVTAIAYETERDHKSLDYMHEFEDGTGPSIIVDERGDRVYLTGGHFDVTDRGFEDRPMRKRLENPALLAVNPHERGTKPEAYMKAKRDPKTGRFLKAGSKKAGTKTRQSNPAKRAKGGHTARRSTSHAASSRKSHGTKKRHSNPAPRASGGFIRSGKGKISLGHTLKTGLMQGTGAVAVTAVWDLLMRLFPSIPAVYKTGVWAAAGKVTAGYVGGNMVAKYVNKDWGQAFADGAAVASTIEIINGFLPKVLPQGAMAGPYDYNYYDPGMGAMLDPSDIGQIIYEDDMGAMLDPSDIGMITAANSGQDVGSMSYGSTSYNGAYGAAYY